MRLLKRITVLLSAVLLWACCLTAYGHDVPDTSRTGTISVTMKYDQKPVGGGTLTLYRVGDIAEDDGNYSFVLTEEFASSGVSLEDLEAEGLPVFLFAYASGKEMTGRTVPIDTNGQAQFDEVEPGLYLTAQTEAAKGYKKISPYLISLPANENGTYIYDVDAIPKVELEKASKPTDKPTGSGAPNKPTGSKLPQTGQLNWPVPVLAMAGVLLFFAGWMLNRKKEVMPDANR